jgi:hypothetical protein
VKEVHKSRGPLDHEKLRRLFDLTGHVVFADGGMVPG